LGLGLAAAGGVASFTELAPFYDLATSEGARFALFAHQELSLPLTAASRMAFLSACYSLSSSIYARAQPTSKRNALLASCRDYALQVTHQAPTLGGAWAIAASAAGELGAATDFSAEILASQRVTPYEQWLAEFRVAVIEDHYSLASAEVIEAEVSDLQVLVHSKRGVRSIAKRYVDHPDFRERVTRVVEEMSQDDQRRFLEALRGAVDQKVAGT
jgi:hypothetical protein